MTSKTSYDKKQYAIWVSIPENRAKKNERARLQRRKKGILPLKEYLKLNPRRHLRTPEAREKARKTSKAKKELHQRAMFWSLVSPCGRVFQFHNLCAFVESNTHLFTPHQLVYMSLPNGRQIPRVSRALLQLSPRGKFVRETVYGWRWHIDGKHHETLLAVLPAPNQ